MESYGNTSISLAKPEQPYHRLCIDNSGDLIFKKGSGKNQLFTLVKSSEGNFQFKSCKNNLLDFYYLCQTEEGRLTVCLSGCHADDLYSQQFRVELVNAKIILLQNKLLERNEVVFQKWQLQRLIFEGYIHLRSIIDPAIVRNCMKYLAHTLGVPGSIHAGGAQVGLGKLGGGVANGEAVKALYTDRLKCLIRSLMGPAVFDDIMFPATQIALRFPEMSEYEDVDDLGTCSFRTQYTDADSKHITPYIIHI